MLMPSVMGTDLFDTFFNDSWFDDRDFRNTEKKLYGHHAKNLMQTDIKEKDDSYELEMDLPGFKKDEIQASVENGYLTIRAAKGLDEDEKEKETGKYIRRERYAGSLMRSFYVGDEIKQEDIHAKFENGILQLSIPKKEAKAIAQNNYIAIE